MSGQETGLGWPSSPATAASSRDGVTSGGLGWPAEADTEQEETS